MIERRENPLRRLFLLFLMWNMRWMTRYLGFIARPFVRWVASREVIACGMRPDDADTVTVIFTPVAGHGEHTIAKRQGRS